jgi:TP901 family phage tail tape measure protein
MAKKISSSDLFDQEDIFKGIRDSASKTIETLKSIQNELKDSAKVLQNDLKNSSVDSAKGLKDFTSAAEAASKVMKEAAIVAEKQAKAEQQKIKADQELIKLEKLKAQETARANKEAEKAAKIARDEASAYKQLEKNTRDLKNQSKELAAQMLLLENAGKKNTKEFRELAREYKNVTSAAKQGDASLKKIDSTVGDNFRNVGNYTGAISSLKNGLSQLGLAFGFGTVVTNASQKIVEFDQKIADLVSITGASGSDLEFFKEQAIELGKSVQGGAGEVIEAYKLIGSAKPELLENAKALDSVTQSAITLSQASGMTLPEAATALTDAMNQFGAPAEQASYFIDALANGALAGSAEIPQVTEALLKFGAVAKTSNVDLDESVGLIETLAEKGLKGAEAGTALRNVMLKLSAPDALPKEARDMIQKLGIDMEAMSDPSKSFAERLEVIKPLLTDNAAMVKVFGTENVVAATNLISSTNRVKELTEAMNVQGTATDQANTRNQTLSFAVNQLKESWNALWLEISSGNGISKVLVNSLSFIAANLSTIMSYVGKAVVAWGAYKTILLAVQAKQFIFNGGLKDSITGMMDVFKGSKQAAQGAQAMGDSVGKAGRAMSAIPWMAIIGAVIELATAFYDIASGAKAAREAQEMMDKYNANAQEKADQRLSKRQNDLNKDISALQRLRNENKITEEEFIKRKQQSISATKSQIKNDIDAVNARKEQYKLELSILEGAGSRADRVALGKKYGGQNFEQVQATLKASMSAADVKIKAYSDELGNVDENLKDVNSELIVNSNLQEDNTDKINAKIPKIKEAVDLEKQIQEERLKLIEDENERAQKQAILSAETRIKEIEKTVADEKQKAELIRLIRENLNKELDALDAQYYAKQEAALAEANRLKKEQENAFADELERITDENYERGLTDQEKEIRAVNAKYFELEDKAQGDAEALKQIEIAKMNELNDINLKYQEIDYKNKEEKAKKDEELAKEAKKKEWETTQEFAQKTTDFLIEQSDKRIAALDKEIEAAEKQSDVLKNLAENGNIQAQQSLAEQERIIAESNLRKQQEQKKQQRIQLANSVFSTYASKVEAGSKNALAETIRDTTLLQAFINSIPAFYDGTEDTGSGGGLDGKGGFHAVLHPHERVLPKSLNDRIGSMSNEDLTRIAQEYQNGRLMRQDVAHSSMDLALLVNEMKDLKQVIKNKPETNIALGEITQSAMEIVERSRKGNTTVYNRFKVRK